MRSPRARSFFARARGAVAAAALLSAASGAPAQEVTYEALAPILAARCVMCHAGASAAAELRLDTLDGLKRGSRNGAVVKAGQPAESELIRRLKGTSLPRMPMTGPPFLSDEEIGLFERWIAAGMPAGAAAAQAATPPPRAPAALPTYADVAPIFATRCAKCHTERGLMGPAPEGYRLTSYAATLDAADRARVVPGSAAASELVRRIRGSAVPRMPLDGPPYLSEAEIGLIERWVDAGARDANGKPAPRPVGARVRLHGKLGTDGRLDDLPLRLSPSVRTERSAPGRDVEVRGRVAEDGAIVVERIRGR